jgi:hypothetical protein
MPLATQTRLSPGGKKRRHLPCRRAQRHLIYQTPPAFSLGNAVAALPL